MVICAIQSGLIYAAPVLVANTTLSLIIQLRSIMLIGMGKSQDQLSRALRILIAAIPWVIWTINFFGILAYALIEPSRLEMNDIGTYCHLNTAVISHVMATWLAVITSAIVIIEAILVVLMYKQGFYLAGKCDASRTAMRVGVFMLQAVVGIGLAIAIIFTKSGTIVLDIIIAIQSPIAALIFGLRTSLLCCSARRKESKLAKTIISPSSRGVYLHDFGGDRGGKSNISVDALPSVTSSVLVIDHDEEGGRHVTGTSEE
ncbi:hypothetical protein D9756_009403 [Leucocoprinus leucothites]|uniref:Uncharacterized protein n=1 Tax=Leucocoprinus leucothites TaxID=201217 RepID=A0A8H5CWD7_9AGAR|nr:hypothetical protein D9756_009403 [Leucoagaricus leucothites]